MKGSESKMIAFMEGADKRFVIPVYQRKYDWKLENCEQLYQDLKKIVFDRRDNHFFGSIVSSVIPVGSKIEYHIIDGQQRLTTISLLLLAMCNMIEQGKIAAPAGNLNEQIMERFLISKWAPEDDRIKLRPVKNDRDALARLFGDREDYDLSSNLTINYQYFCNVLQKEEVPVEDLNAAIGKLEIISITLDPGDNAQMIFESLNSTGLALTEGDKIRNYVLMGLSATKQSHFYDNYWTKIEKCTNYDVSGFVRDYLSIKQQITPRISGVYQAFKIYAEENGFSVESLLKDLLLYARLFEKLLICKSGLKEPKLDACLYRLKRLDIAVTRPFLMEVLRLNQEEKLTPEDVLNVFQIVESYLFRRNICDVPTSALNKVFLLLNREILHYDNTAEQYVDKLIYSLLCKKESSRFPDDEEFTASLSTKQVYQMRGTYKAYLFERFENYGTIETKDVYEHLDQGTYTIEHIMPQHLTISWRDSLGPAATQIHSMWCHRLANLTLSGYNPKLSNNPFLEKRDAPEVGYLASGLRMNQMIAQKDSWGLAELQERNAVMLEQAKKIWSYPQTSFVPVKREFDSCTLDDEDAELTGRDIIRYSYQNTVQPVASWMDMFEHMVKFLHQKDKSVLTSIAFGEQPESNLSNYVTLREDSLRAALMIDECIFIEKNTSTAMKLSLLRQLFRLYDAEPMDLVFYLRDAENDKIVENNRKELYKKYWETAIPELKKQHEARGTFGHVNPNAANVITGTFGIKNCCVRCGIADGYARVDFLFCNNSDEEANKQLFDSVFLHREEIEQKLDAELVWERGEKQKICSVTYYLRGVSVKTESDWLRIRKFHVEWSKKLIDAVVPYIQQNIES